LGFFLYKSHLRLSFVNKIDV